MYKQCFDSAYNCKAALKLLNYIKY